MRYGDCHKPTMEVANFYLNVSRAVTLEKFFTNSFRFFL